jgi:TolB protein
MSDAPIDDMPFSDFERRLQRRVDAYAAAHDPVVDADRIAYQAEDAAQATTRGWFGRGVARQPSVGRARRAGVWVPVLLGLLLLLGAAVFAAGVLLRLNDHKPVAANGLIAYGLGRDFPRPIGRIHVMNADGSGDRDAGPGSCPRYLADGSAMTYIAGWDESGSVPETVIAEPDGSGVRDVGPFVGNPTFSPDGLQYAQLEGSAQSDTFAFDIWLTTVSDGTRRLLVPAGAGADATYQRYSTPTWSPDGSSIAFAVTQLFATADSSGQFRKEIDVVDVESGLVRVVSERLGTDFVAIAWSPDSRSLAYLGLPDGSPPPGLPAPDSPPDQWNQDVFVVGADGTGDRRITSDESFEYAPAWSPDGSAIATITYLSTFDARLRVAEVAGPEGNIATFTGPPARSYVWSPDGTVILYMQRERDTVTGEVLRSRILTVDPRFANPPQTLVETEGEEISCISWQTIWR